MNLPEKILTIVVIEDHKSFREGLVTLLNTQPGFTCAAAYGSSEEALNSLPKCDIVLLDINLPGLSGIETIPYLKHKIPEVKVFMLTVHEDDEAIFASLKAGADGYLLKKTKPSAIPLYLADAWEGGSPMHPLIARRVLDYFNSEKKQDPGYQLTPRESEILNLLVQGNNNRQIADRLFISYETVRNHTKKIYEKLSVNSRSQAVALMLGKFPTK